MKYSMNTFDQFEYRLFIYFAFSCRRLLWKLVTSAVQNPRTHTCTAMIYLRIERRWPSCVCIYKLT